MTTRRFYANNAPQQTLSGSITSGATTCTIAGSFSGWPVQFPYYAALDLGTASFEIVSVTGVVGTTATIVRALDGTVATAHPAGATLNQVFVRQDMDEANAHTSATTGVHGVAGSVVGTSDVQTLTNKTLTSPTVNTPLISNPTSTGDAGHPALVGRATTAGGKTLSLQNSSSVEKVGVDDAGSITASGNVVAPGATFSGAVSAGSITGVAGQSVAVPGAVTMFAGATAPTGWQLCDGSAISRTTFSALFAVIGTTYGVGDGSTTFNVPNLQDNFAVGKSGTKALGSVGGSSSHQHPMSANAWAQMNPFTGAYGANLKSTGVTAWNENTRTSGTAGTATNGITRGVPLDGVTDLTTALPPYVAMNFIIKT